MKTLLSLSLGLLLLSPALHAQEVATDTTGLTTLVLLDDSSITGRISDADEKRYTVVTATGEIHTLPKNAVKEIGPAGTIVTPERMAELERLRSLRTDIEQNWDIRLVTGERVPAVGLAALRDDQIVVIGNRGERAIPVANLAAMKRNNGGHFWTGAALGAGVTALPALALVIAPIGKDSPGIQYFVAPAGVVIGALLGGVVGSFFENSDEFDFTMLSEEQKALGAEKVIEFDRR